MLDSVYNRLQIGINFCYNFNLANTIFYRQEENSTERTNAVVKNLSHQIHDISVHMDQILHGMESLNNRITQY